MSGGDRVWQLPQLAAGRGGRRSATLRVDVSCGGGRDALWLLDTASLPRFSLGLIVLHPRFSFLLFLLMLCVWFRVSAACGLFFEKQLLRVGEVTFFFCLDSLLYFRCRRIRHMMKVMPAQLLGTPSPPGRHFESPCPNAPEGHFALPVSPVSPGTCPWRLLTYRPRRG